VGAVGSVGRSAVFTAKERGAAVIAGVLKRQMDEAKTLGADRVVATDDDTAIANLRPLDAVADAVGGGTAEKLIARVKPGGVLLRSWGHRGTPRSTRL
jgi:NADPH:quinone reductase-like Zn-dependent oxidoreductase